MERSESIDLLNATHAFPCAFVLKVIGVSADDFMGRILAAIREDGRVEDDIPCSTRATPNGKHIAITLEPTLHSAEHVLDIYERIRAVEGVVMTM